MKKQFFSRLLRSKSYNEPICITYRGTREDKYRKNEKNKSKWGKTIDNFFFLFVFDFHFYMYIHYTYLCSSYSLP